MPRQRTIHRIAHTARRRAGALLAVLIGVVAILVLLSYAMLTINAGVRAYVNGESLYSKAQKDAVFHLLAYIDSGNPADYRRFEDSLAVPLGDRAARIALQRDPVEPDAARRGLLQGGNHPEDINAMIFIFRHLSWLPDFGEAIAVWRSADDLVIELRDTAGQAREMVQAGDAPTADLDPIRDRVLALNRSLGRLEERFSRVMGKAARRANRLLQGVFVMIALLLMTAGGLLLRRITAHAFEQEAQFRATFEEAGVGIAHFDLQGRCINANRALERILGGPEIEPDAELSGISLETIDADPSGTDLRGEIDPLLGDETASIRLERRLKRLDGSTFWVNANVTLMRDIRKRPLYFIFVIEDITERKRLADQLDYQARHDPVTGLINRYEFERILELAVDRARNRRESGALIYVDLDQFKHVNDSSGHAAGDALLERLGPTIRSAVRTHDKVARIGGDEFAVLLHDCAPGPAQVVAEKLRRAIGEFRFRWHGREFKVSASLGAVPFGDNACAGGELESGRLLSLADAACYAAKESGRDRVYMVGSDDPLPARFAEEIETVDRVRAAIDEGRFELVYQPIVALQAGFGHVELYEALVRMVAPDGSMVPPTAFIRAAERFGLVPRIDLWVLERVIATLREQPASRRAITVNLSAVSINSADFCDRATDLVADDDAPSDRLCFEITETAAITNLDSALAFMQRMQSHDCRFALDDFGSGFSSFAYLPRLPVDFIKIDGQFIRDLHADSTREAIVRAIREVARSLGIRTIAEFVEEDATRERLAGIGIDFAQGFGIARPGALPDNAS